MGTDWPGVPAYSRLPGKKACCQCVHFFTERTEPPPYYLWAPIGTQNNSELDYLNLDLVLGPYPGNNSCRYIGFKPNDQSPLAHQVILEFKTDSLLWWPEIQIDVYGINPVVSVSYHIIPFLIYELGNRVPRSTEFDYVPGSGWILDVDTPVPDWGPPVGIPHLTPTFCPPS